MTTKKYTLTDKTINYYERILHRIQRLSDGQFGGFIESEDNLSHEGNCWVGGEAKVYENAKVHENAQVFGNTEIGGEIEVDSSVSISRNILIRGDMLITGDISISETQPKTHRKNPSKKTNRFIEIAKKI